MRSTLRSIFFLVNIFLYVSSYASEIKNIGIPYIQNYSKNSYQAGNQNWSVTKDERGVMFFGNANGLLSFDGKHWQTYFMPNNIIVRAVCADGNGKIYAGGFGDFGYWSYNKKGKFSYTSLSRKLKQKAAGQDEIWKIFVDGQRIIFQSFHSIYIYEKGTFNIIKSKNPILFLNKVGQHYFTGILSEGLFELKGKQLTLVPGSEILGNGVLTVLPYKKNQFLIGTAREGLYIFNGEKVLPWENQANTLLKGLQLNNGVALLGKYFAFGTILGGIIIIHENGSIVQRINKSGGLQNNTVLSLYADNKQDLWAGLDNGIDRIDITSPLYFYLDKTGDFGTVYSSIVHNGKIYLGTNQGLYYSNWSESNKLFQSFNFKLIDRSQGQVWNLSLIDGELLCGHNEGTFRVEGESINRISSIKGGWTIGKLSTNPNFLIQGTYSGLVIYKKNAHGQWSFSHQVKGFDKPTRFVEQDAKGNIWASDANKGVYRLRLDPEFGQVIEAKAYDKSHGLPSDYHVNISNLNNQIVFSSDAGFYIYDEISDKFFPYQHLNKRLGSFSASNRIINAGGDRYWFINHGKVALAQISTGKFSIDFVTFSSLNGSMVQYYENISRINESIYLISVDDGFVIYDVSGRKEQRMETLPQVLIRRLENITETPSLVTENATAIDGVRIPYASNNIRVSYSLPYYRVARIQYQYYLDGYSDKWSDWSSSAQKEFTNLSWGDYKFKVRARVNGIYISDEAVIEFKVLPPWYASFWAYMVYFLLALLGLYLLREWYKLKLRKHQDFIHQKFQEEKEELLQKEAVANEQKIVRLMNEQLKADLDSKNRELANSAMNIVYKNELLQGIKDELSHLKDAAGKKLSAEQLKKIYRVIDQGMNDERDWNLFETSFNEAHESFFIKLKSRYPDLVPNDIKLCAYLRMNMSSKEMASLLNISVRGVEIRRYRLRKKLNLEHDKNLAEFFMEL
ncbi:triple tyrosine motif-containing protein [Desertivirga arenae]|uniref:triple tyrosine motif-containing protein n=1 Tax=Desertivirga arenae TaxID=2810309 RepID=UPI001A9637D6|nr:triple tyrosine motif-containing protein [Pedobacter sp. SYSU D00823]